MRFILFLISFSVFLNFLIIGVHAETRIALVIGNSDYQGGANKLDNPVNDAELMSQTLSDVGFQVTKVVNATRFEMRKAMLDYSRLLTGSNTIGVFYFAGHGMQVDGQNYLLPIDAAPARKDELALQGVALGEFLRTLDSVSGQGGRLNVVILDACRNNPFARGWRSVSRGLATIDAPSGTLIAFATAPGDVAADGNGEENNSPYTLALTQMIKRPGLPIEQTFKGARRLVWKWTQQNGKPQVPWESTSLRGDFYFIPKIEDGDLVKSVKKSKAPAVLFKKHVAGEKTASLKEKSKKVSRLETQDKTGINKHKKGECVLLGSSLGAPLSVYQGMVLCSANKVDRARIKRVRKRGITYSVNGSYDITCTLTDLCQFDWESAPLFKVRILKGPNAEQKFAGFFISPN